MVIFVGGAENVKTYDENQSVAEHVESLMLGGMTKKEAVKAVASARGVPKSEVYRTVCSDAKV